MTSRLAPSLAVKKADAGRIGGLQTFLRHGREHYVKAGKLGGRPRALTPAEFREKEKGAGASGAGMKEDGGLETPRASRSLPKLRRLYAERQRSSCPEENQG